MSKVVKLPLLLRSSRLPPVDNRVMVSLTKYGCGCARLCKAVQGCSQARRSQYRAIKYNNSYVVMWLLRYHHGENFQIGKKIFISLKTEEMYTRQLWSVSCLSCNTTLHYCCTGTSTIAVLVLLYVLRPGGFKVEKLRPDGNRLA